jgi:Anti-sigma factor NepR
MSIPKKDGDKLSCESGQMSLPPELQGQLGQRLRDSYSDLVKQPIPDKFLLLLDKLKNTETPSGPTGGKS